MQLLNEAQNHFHILNLHVTICTSTMRGLFMNINQLQYLEHLVKYESISKAAKACYLSQSALTRQIKMMEKELGFLLFERKNNGVQLTPEGLVFYQETRKTIQSYENAINQVNQFIAQKKMNIRIFISNYLNDTILYACKNARSRLAGYTFSFHCERLLYSTKALLNNDVDLVLLSDYSEAHESLHFEPLFHCYNALKVPASHPFASLKSITLKQLENQTILVPSDQQNRENILYINHLLKDPKYKINVIEFKSIEEAHAENVINSHSLATLSYFDSASNYKLIPILDAETVEIGMIYRKEDELHLKPVLDVFKEYFRNYAQKNELIFPCKTN